MIDKKFERNVFKMFISNILIVLSGVISGFILPNIFGIRGLQYCQPFADICTFIVGLLVVRKVIGDLKANMKKN